MDSGTPVADFKNYRAAHVPNSGVWRGLGYAVALSVAIAAGYRFPVERLFDAVTASLFLGAAALLTARQFAAPITGVSLLLLTAVIAPIMMPRGLTGCFLLAVFVCVTWPLRTVILQRGRAISSARIVLAAIAFILVAVFAFLSGLYPWFPVVPAPIAAQVGGLALFVISGGLFLAVGHQIESAIQLERLTWAFVLAGGVVVVTQLPIDFPGLFEVRRLVDPGSVGSLFWVWLVAMSFGQALCNVQLDMRLRMAAFAIGAVALSRGLLLAFAWASGWLPPLVALGVILLMRLPRTTIGVATLLVVPAVLVSDRMLDAVMDNESYSWMTRLQAWAVVLDIVKANPLLGFGPANYYHYTPLFPILGWWVSFNSHSNYLDLVAQTGVLGLLAFLWFAFESGRLTLKLWMRAPAGFSRAYAAGTLAGLVGSLTAGFLGDWIIPFVYNIGMTGFRSSLLFWFFLGGSFALYHVTVHGSRAPGIAHRPSTV